MDIHFVRSSTLISDTYFIDSMSSVLLILDIITLMLQLISNDSGIFLKNIDLQKVPNYFLIKD